MHLIDTLVLSHSIDALNLNQNDGVFDWVSQLTILAALVGVIALAVACKARRGMLGLLAALLAFLFVEDLLQLHDRLGLGSDWQLVYLPVLAPTFALLWAVGEWAQGAAGRSMRVGLVLLAVSLFLGHVTEPLLRRGHWGAGSTPYEIKVVFKQDAELVGWGFAAVTLLALALPAVRSVRSRSHARRSIIPSHHSVSAR